MKKLIALCAGLLAAANLCAVVLPDGQNIRADNVTNYDSGAIRSATPRNTVEITSPIGPIPTSETVYYYENGTVKSIRTRSDDITGKLVIETNFGPISDFDDRGYNAVTFTFYESGSLWYIEGLASNPMKTPNGDFTATDLMLFYDAGGADVQIVHKTNLAGRQSTTVTTKAVTIPFEVNYYSTISGESEWMETLRYGYDGFAISFYKNGNIEKIFIDEDTAQDMTLQTSLGELFVGGGRPYMFWEDGSLKQCWNDDVLQTTIYGKNVQIPVGGLLRFRRDGSVWAYTTISGVSYTVGKRTYETTDGADTFVLDEKGNVVQVLKNINRSVSLEPVVLKFYDSGNPKKVGSRRAGLSETNTWNDAHFYVTENMAARVFFYEGKMSLSLARGSSGYVAEIICPECLVDMVYFADNGYPSSYDVLKTVVDADLKNENIREEFRLDGSLFIEMTEDSEFVVAPDRVRGLEWKRNY